MKRNTPLSPYLVTGAVFLGICIAGAWIWDWGRIAFSYLLLIYCLVAIGIRLDDVVERLDRFDASCRRASRAADERSGSRQDIGSDHLQQLGHMRRTLEHIAGRIDRIADRMDESEHSNHR